MSVTCREWSRLAETRRQVKAKIRVLKVESRRLARQLRSDHAELRRVAGDGHVAAVLLDRIREAEQRETAIQVELADLARQSIDESDVARALASFDPVWDSLSPREQARVLRLLIARVEYDGGSGEVAITFQPHGIKTLAEEAESCV
jgi:site-specific DNA recombinase